MKTILYTLAVAVSCFVLVSNASAQYGPPPPPPPPDACHRPYNDGYHDARMQSFYYYPQSNVYYNPAADQYIFYSRNAWVVSDRLPYYYRIRREPRVVVYHNGFDVWNDNRIHCARYRDYRRAQPDVAYGRSYPNDRSYSNDGYNHQSDNYGYPDRRDDWRK